MSDLTPEEQAIADQLAADEATAAQARLEQEAADAEQARLDQLAADEAAAAAVKPAEKKPVAKKTTAAKEASSDYPCFMQSTTQFPYVDPDSGHRFSPGTPIKVDVEPKEGSWLDSQIKAGLIAKA